MDRREFNARFTLLECLEDSAVRSFSALSHGDAPVSVHLLPSSDHELYGLLRSDLDRLLDAKTDGLEVFEVSERMVVVTPSLSAGENLEAWLMERMTEVGRLEEGDSFGMLTGASPADPAAGIQIGELDGVPDSDEVAADPGAADQASAPPAPEPTPSGGGGLTQYFGAEAAADSEQPPAEPLTAEPSPPTDPAGPPELVEPVESSKPPVKPDSVGAVTADEGSTDRVGSDAGGSSGGLTAYLDVRSLQAEPPPPAADGRSGPTPSGGPDERSGKPSDTADRPLPESRPADGLTRLLTGLQPVEPEPHANTGERPVADPGSSDVATPAPSPPRPSGLTGHFDVSDPDGQGSRSVPNTSLSSPGGSGASGQDSGLSDLADWRSTPPRRAEAEPEGSNVGLGDYMDRLNAVPDPGAFGPMTPPAAPPASTGAAGGPRQDATLLSAVGPAAGPLVSSGETAGASGSVAGQGGSGLSKRTIIIFVAVVSTVLILTIGLLVFLSFRSGP